MPSLAPTLVVATAAHQRPGRASLGATHRRRTRSSRPATAGCRLAARRSWPCVASRPSARAA
eukprot:6942058-Prymnesium_polylepis.2